SIRKGKQQIYAYSDEERDAVLKKSRGEVGRFKGLGEMDPEELWKTTMDPSNRLLMQVNMEDAAEADEIFSILRGDAVEPRKHFTEVNGRPLDVATERAISDAKLGSCVEMQDVAPITRRRPFERGS